MHRIDELSGAVVDEAIRLHREVGPGLLESVYEIVLAGPVGLLLNFSEANMKDGIRRVVNDYRPDGLSAVSANSASLREPTYSNQGGL